MLFYAKKNLKKSLLIGFCAAGLVSNAQVTGTLEISYLGNDTIRYCNNTIPVAPDISVKGPDFDSDNGIRVSIANYLKGEDTLIYQGTGNLKATWNNAYGYIEILGTGKASDYELAVKNVFYMNRAVKPTLGARSVSVTLRDADYLPLTGHFYKFVRQPGIYWTAARDSARSFNRKYFGLTGYLATITSQEENDFIWSKLTGIGWIGASDAEKEGEWKWMTGPEAGSKFYDHPTRTTLQGWFSFWNTGEPNNVQKTWGADEDYAHINMNPSTIPRSWNDLSNESDGPGSAYYYSQGYLIEYGGMPGDPVLKLSASVKIMVDKIAFSREREFEICSGTDKKLNSDGSANYTYSWTPVKKISNPNSASPVVNPDENTTYKVIGKYGSYCIDSAFFQVKVNPLPVLTWKQENSVCEGDTLRLDPGNHSSYLWGDLSTSRYLTIKSEGWYTVTVTNEFNCTLKDSANVRWSTKPGINFSSLDTLVCGKMDQKISFSFDQEGVTSLMSTSQSGVIIVNPNSPNPEIKVDKYGKYRFELHMTDNAGCRFDDSIRIGFHNQPQALYLLDAEKCQGYNLNLAFSGETVEPALYKWLSNDTVFSSGFGLTEITIPLGFGIRNRTVGLEINEQGCIQKKTELVKVTPKLDFWADKQEGCTPFTVYFANTDIEEVAEYNWEFGDGNSSLEKSPQHTYMNGSLSDTTYMVSFKVVSAEGCENRGSLTGGILVHPIPSVDLDFNEAKCYADTVSIFYIGSGSDRDKYYWEYNTLNNNEILSNPGNTKGPLRVRRNAKPTMEVYIQVESEFGCLSENFKKVMKFRPGFFIEMDTVMGCPPLNVNFKAIPLIVKDTVIYSWDFGSGDKVFGQQLSYKFDRPDSKNDVLVRAFSPYTGCSDTLVFTDTINVYPVPDAEFIPQPEVALVSDSKVFFKNQSNGAILFEWDFGDNSPLSNERETSHVYDGMGIYYVLLTAENELGCIDTTGHKVTIAFDRLFPPNAFSPNSPDEEDRVFRIYSEGVTGEGYFLVIYNRWGERIFESKSQETGWDGKMKNGNPAPAGVYSWILQYHDFLNNKHRQQGNVTLLY